MKNNNKNLDNPVPSLDKSLPTLLKLLKGTILCKLPINPNDYKMVDRNLIHAYKQVEDKLQNGVETEKN